MHTTARILSVLLIAGFLIPAPAIAEVIVQVNSPVPPGNSGCTPNGFDGTISDGAVVAHFESCETVAGAHSQVTDVNGVVKSEVLINELTGDMTILIGGVEYTGIHTPAEIAQMQQTLDTPETELIVEELWSALVESGQNPALKPMGALAVHFVLYEGIVEDIGDGGCMGCCGVGCSGCSGCWTKACLLHDMCVAEWGHFAPQCTQFFYVALVSAWCCRGHESLFC